jgi:hypothetical protein
MRVYAPNGTVLAAAAPFARRAPSGTFTVTEPAASQPQNAGPGVHALGGIDALVVLQGIETATERRRRLLKHGRRALDALDEVKVALLAGTLDRATMLRLKSAAAELKTGSGDTGLDGVLAEIDLRVEVELAKAGLS